MCALTEPNVLKNEQLQERHEERRGRVSGGSLVNLLTDSSHSVAHDEVNTVRIKTKLLIEAFQPVNLFGKLDRSFKFVNLLC